jgi:hypothetical protein
MLRAGCPANQYQSPIPIFPATQPVGYRRRLAIQQDPQLRAVILDHPGLEQVWWP